MSIVTIQLDKVALWQMTGQGKLKQSTKMFNYIAFTREALRLKLVFCSIECQMFDKTKPSSMYVSHLLASNFIVNYCKHFKPV